MAMKMQKAPKAGYADFVNNTVEYGAKLNTCITPEEKADAVRGFLEKGGLRTEKTPVSERKYSSTIYFQKDAQFQVGTKNVSQGGGQQTVPTTVTIKAGLYWFNYDTENGATLYSMNNKEDIARISLGGVAGSSQKMGPTEAHATGVFFDAIMNTSQLYGKNKNFATLVEKTVDVLYGEGHTFSAYSGPHMANMQSTVGLTAVKRTIRGVLKNLETKTLNNWNQRVYHMMNPKSTSLPGSIFIPKNSTMFNNIRDELLMSNDTMDNLYVGFDVKGDSMVMNVFSYADLDPDKKYNPVLMYQVQGGVTGNTVNFMNAFSSDGKIVPEFRKDFDNSGLKGEAEIESYLTALFKMRGLGSGNIYLFGSNITLDETFLLRSLENEYGNAKP
ncbi:MAG: hypothetical protein ABIG39_07875 [Candidatus Micrarchaeota archaeon]